MIDTIQQDFANSAETYPDNIAIWTEKESITYAALAERSDALCQWLLQKKLSNGQRIALILPKSIEALTAILAILKLGCAYVPLGDSWSEGRLKKILDDGDFSLVITDAKDRGLKIDNGSSLTINSDDWISIFDKPLSSPRLTSSPPTSETLAYVLYTSGSTGVPKGVCVSHRAARHFPIWAKEEFNINHQDRIAAIAPLTFDLSTFDLFSSFAAGASIYLVPERYKMFPARFSEFLQNHKITTIYAVPSTLGLLTHKGNLENRDFSALKTVLFAGEVFPVPLFKQFRDLMPDHIEYANLYGPTETNVCSYYRMPKDFDQPSIPIGRAVPGMHLFIRPEDNSDKTVVGSTGELCVAGATVMSGYWGMDDDQAPYWTDDTDGVESRAYGTGDEVTLEENGIWIYHGRRDKMVKIWGYRVELGEIESCILDHEAIDMVAVVKRAGSTALGDELVAFIVIHDIQPDMDDNLQSVYKLCKNNLPPYMVPKEIIVLAEMPTNNSGKIDRLKLESIAADKKIS